MWAEVKLGQLSTIFPERQMFYQGRIGHNYFSAQIVWHVPADMMEIVCDNIRFCKPTLKAWPVNALFFASRIKDRKW